jgi:hypothetical protein
LLISSEDSLSGGIPNIIKLPLGNSGKVKRLFDDHIAFCILHSNKATYFPLFPLKYCFKAFRITFDIENLFEVYLPESTFNISIQVCSIN